MAKDLSKILVIDIESTCWEGDPPEGEISEIIEIGLTEVINNHTMFELGESHQVIVRPERSTVSEFCTKLTGWTQEEVKKGISFGEACKKLKKEFNSKQFTWASYEDYDRRQFERQCQREGVGYPFGPTHLNVKNLFGFEYSTSERNEVGMDEALSIAGMSLEGRHHCGMDDSRNIAKLLIKIL